MDTSMEWLGAFPALQSIYDPVWAQVAGRARRMVFSADTGLFTNGAVCSSLIFVVSGSVRIYKTLENGKELVLCHLHSGECCSLTASTLLSGARYSANAVTETSATCMFLPGTEFLKAFDESKGFRRFICSQLWGRIDGLLALLENLGTRNIEVRLARWLLNNRTKSDCVHVTHRQLASELCTAREVVSRYLKCFEKEGLVKLSRKNIVLADVTGLDKRINAAV